MKKVVKKTVPAKKTPRKTVRRSKSTLPLFHIRYTIITVSVLVIALFVTLQTKTHDRPYVLGTSVLLADHGSDDSGSGGGESGSGSGGSNSGSSSTSGGSNSGSGSNSGGGASEHHSDAVTQTAGVAEGTFVDCVGPDGKHFQTTFKACSELNTHWGHSNFSFSVLKSTKPGQNDQQRVRATVSAAPKLEPTGTERSKKLEVKPKKPEDETELDTIGTELEVSQDGTHAAVKAKKPDGSEVELGKDDALEKVNSELSDTGVSIEDASGGGALTIRTKSVKANTHLPISIDPVTKTLTVTTKAGTKAVTVLPDQAVERLLQNKVITSVQSEVASESGTPTVDQQVNLTELNNQPVFQVQGFSNKKILGLIPASFAKTVFVSAEDGSIVKTDETFLSKLLETVSF